jgi:hypothetical protein
LELRASAVAVCGRTHTDGQVHAEEFKYCLGAMGMISPDFPNVLFSMIDTDRSGTISFAEFLNWLLTMQYGTEEEKLHFGFRLCDQDGDGRITKQDLALTITVGRLKGQGCEGLCAATRRPVWRDELAKDDRDKRLASAWLGVLRRMLTRGRRCVGVQNMFQVLTGLHVQGTNMDVTHFVNTVFDKLGLAEGGEIGWDSFLGGAKSIETFLRSLGSRSVSYHTPSAQRKGEMIIGGQKWRFILNMMLGLEFAVRKVNPSMAEAEEDDAEEGAAGGGSERQDSKMDSTKTVSKETFVIPTNDGCNCRIVAYGSEAFQQVRSKSPPRVIYHVTLIQ